VGRVRGAELHAHPRQIAFGVLGERGERACRVAHEHLLDAERERYVAGSSRHLEPGPAQGGRTTGARVLHVHDGDVIEAGVLEDHLATNALLTVEQAGKRVADVGAADVPRVDAGVLNCRPRCLTAERLERFVRMLPEGVHPDADDRHLTHHAATVGTCT
jgi:hypothetical protein